MTQIEFNKVEWKAGMTCEYMNTKYSITSVNFQEMIIELDSDIWVRCENVTLIN